MFSTCSGYDSGYIHFLECWGSVLDIWSLASQKELQKVTQKDNEKEYLKGFHTEHQKGSQTYVKIS